MKIFEAMQPGQKIDRRTLLRGAGAAMALPLFEAMMPGTARAATGMGTLTASGAPKRLAFLFVPNGINMSMWRPATEGANFLLPSTMEPLAAVKDSLLVLSGLTQQNAFALGDGGGDHARSAAAWLTGCHPRKTDGADMRAGVSADQIAARYLGRRTRFSSLELGVERGSMAGNCDSGYSCSYSHTISWRTDTTPVPKETSPRAVFERLFGNGDDPESSARARALRKAENRSILDSVLSDAGSLQRQLGTHDREKLDEYLTSVREIEERVHLSEKQALPAAQKAAIEATLPVHTPDDMGEHIRLMGDMMILAFQTDQTRVCTFMFADEGSNRSYREIGIADGHHDLSHHDNVQDKLEKLHKINHYHTTQLAYVLNKMQGIREVDGSLLDNTLLVYGGGISDGNRHNHDDLPIIVAGGKGIVKTGRHLVYKDGTPMTNLFMTVFDRMGMPTDKIGAIGDSTGKLVQLF